MISDEPEIQLFRVNNLVLQVLHEYRCTDYNIYINMGNIIMTVNNMQ